MFLNGFNDNLPGFPRLPCKYTPCADPYMGTEQPGTPVDPSKSIQGPFGTVSCLYMIRFIDAR
jgi:glucan 1,3-beta-glucosidase